MLSASNFALQTSLHSIIMYHCNTWIDVAVEFLVLLPTHCFRCHKGSCLPWASRIGGKSAELASVSLLDPCAKLRGVLLIMALHIVQKDGSTSSKTLAGWLLIQANLYFWV